MVKKKRRESLIHKGCKHHGKTKQISNGGMSLIEHVLSPYKCHSIDGKKIDRDHKQLKKIIKILMYGGHKT